jgi:hypothetical protein
MMMLMIMMILLSFDNIFDDIKLKKGVFLGGILELIGIDKEKIRIRKYQLNDSFLFKFVSLIVDGIEGTYLTSG